MLPLLWWHNPTESIFTDSERINGVALTPPVDEGSLNECGMYAVSKYYFKLCQIGHNIDVKMQRPNETPGDITC